MDSISKARHWRFAPLTIALMAIAAACSDPGPLRIDTVEAPLTSCPDLSTVSTVNVTDPFERFDDVGALPGGGGVSQNGDYQYRIPIWTPPSRSGFGPKLALQYNSSGGPSVAGVGWGLSGISRIHRCAKVPARDGYSAKVTWQDEEDSFCLDGQYLVEVELAPVPETIPGRGTSSMQPTNEYRLERDDLTRIILFKNGGSLNAWIRIHTDGRADYYGDTANARGDYVETAGYHRLYWYRSASVDTRHNLIEYDYQEDGADSQSAVRVPIEIRWGRATDGAYASAAENRIELHYWETNYGGTTRWLNGARSTSAMMLDEIRIYAPSNWSSIPEVVRRYVLNHELSPRTQRNLLKSVKVCGPSVSQCLPATTFDYGTTAGPDPVSFVTSPQANTVLGQPPPGEPALQATLADITGDGYDDLVEMSQNELVVKRASVSFNPTTGITDVSFFTSPNLTLTANGPYGLIDWDGDGNQEVVVGSGEIYDFSVASQSWEPTGFDLDGECGNYFMEEEDPPSFQGGICLYLVGDYNGDGLADVVRGWGEYSDDAPTPQMGFELYINPNASPAPPLAVPKDSLLFYVNDASLLGTGILGPRLVDLDGDGRVELSVDQSKIYVDLNGDGLPDHFTLGGHGYINRGNGQHDGPFFNEAMGPNGTYLSPVLEGEFNPISTVVADIDRDGRQDVVRYNDEFDLQIHLSRVGRLAPTDVTLPMATLTPSVTGAYPPLVGDVDGNGLADILVNGTLLQQIGINADKMISVVDGFDATETLSYRPLAKRGLLDPDPVHEPAYGVSCAFPQRCLRRGHPVIESRKVSDPDRPNTTRVHHYHYKGRRADIRGRGDLGFEEIEERVAGITTTTTYSFDWIGSPYGRMYYMWRGLPVTQRRTIWHEGLTRELSTVQTFTRDVALVYGGDGYAIWPLSSETQTFEDGSATASVTASVWYEDLDANKFPQRIVSTVDGGDELLTDIEYTDPSTVNGILGLRERVTTTSTTPSDESATVQVKYLYDSRGLVESKEIQPQDSEYFDVFENATTTYTRSPEGLVTQETTTDATSASRTTTFAHDADGIFVTKITNDVGHVVQAEHDRRLGVTRRVSDEVCVVTELTHDMFGRQVGTYHADGWWEARTHMTGVPELKSPAQIVDTDAAGQQVTQHLDAFGRAVHVDSIAFDGSTTRISAQYDERGQVTARSLPRAATDPPEWFTFGYDDAGRPRFVIHPTDGLGDPVDTWSYPSIFEARHVDRVGRTTVQYLDVHGRIAAAEKLDGSQGSLGMSEFTHGPFGTVTEVSEPLMERQISYDALGRKRSVSDPDTGTREFTYNGFGDLESELTSNGFLEEYDHDGVGRVTSFTSEEGTYEYEYDVGPTAAGRLTKATAPGGVERSFAHDALGRVHNVTLTDQIEPMTIDYVYDGIGRPLEVHYPSELAGQPFIVRYGYAYAGYLSTIEDVTGQNVTLWKATGRDHHGRATNVTLRDGDIDMAFAYDPYFGKATAISAFEGPNLIYQTSSTLFDDGKLDTITDGVHGHVDAHTYDDLGRLKDWTWTRNGTKKRRTYQYDPTQRLDIVEDSEWDGQSQNWMVLAKTGYDYDGERPHLVVDAGDRTFSWDQAGRLRERNNSGSFERVIETYSTFDLPTRGVVDFGERVEFEIAYDALGSRHKKTVGDHETTYFDALYERRVTGEQTSHVFKVYAETGLVAQLELGEGEPAWKYVIPDLRGSPGAMLQEGKPATYFYYEPNGKRVDEVGAGVSLPDIEGIHEGLTGHEHELDLDLVNMGGRVFDPTLRRFATPDPFSQGVTAGHLMDPYRHVLGDPINLTDPTGFYEEGDPHLEDASAWDNDGVDDMDWDNAAADAHDAQMEAADAADAQAAAAAEASMDFGDPSQEEDEWEQSAAKAKDDSGKPGMKLTVTNGASPTPAADTTGTQTTAGPGSSESTALEFTRGVFEGAVTYGIPVFPQPTNDWLAHWRSGGRITAGLASTGPALLLGGPTLLIGYGVAELFVSETAAAGAVAAGGAVAAIASGISLSIASGNPGSGSGPANWKSVPQFGHTFKTHGQGTKNTGKLTGRAKGWKKPQGQWLDNEKAANFLANLKIKGSASVPIPKGLGQVIKPDGSIVSADWASVFLRPDGSIKSAFPILGAPP